MGTRRRSIYGPETWAKHAGRDWSHWDLWFCLVSLTDADGDWETLTDEALMADDKASVVEFNPWQWSGQEEVAQAFFEQVGVALGRPEGSRPARRLAAKWREYASYLKVGAEVLGVARGLLILILGVLGAVGVASLAPPVWVRTVLAAIGGTALVLAAFLKWGGRVANAASGGGRNLVTYQSRTIGSEDLSSGRGTVIALVI